ncbi:hypothetical protein [Bradyrhizobium canariense]|uniref:hypothetical protein n=1 Tax=Bradyrhizobium canariense TaxID=255045 RepID=UPI001177C7F6|nr:hypothetical protein [Bradyrhizobium canariense]
MRQLIRSAGAKIHIDLNAFEQVFAKLKKSAPQGNEPSIRCAPQSASSSTPSHPKYAHATSKTQALEANAMAL